MFTGLELRSVTRHPLAGVKRLLFYQFKSDAQNTLSYQSSHSPLRQPVSNFVNESLQGRQFVMPTI